MKKLLLLIIPLLICSCKVKDNSTDFTTEHQNKIESFLNENSTRGYENINIILLKYDEKTNTYYYKVESIITYSNVYYEENYYVVINDESMKIYNLH